MLTKKLLPGEDRLKSIDIVKVKLVKEGNFHYGTKRINNSEDVVSVAKKFLADEDREIFIVFNLNNKGRINSIHVVSIGSLTASVVHPREIFKTAILSNASHIILAHNHPSGGPEPSPEDIHITRRLLECGDLLDIKISDHIIIGDGAYASFIKIEGKKIWWDIKHFEDHQEAN